MSVANQRTIVIRRTSDKTTKNYLKVSHENLNKALQKLDPKAFLLWLYFVNNADGYIMDLYPIHFCNWSNLSDSSFRRAFKELVEKGYLEESPKKKNTYLFKEYSTIKTEEENTVVKTVNDAELEELFPRYFY